MGEPGQGGHTLAAANPSWNFNASALGDDGEYEFPSLGTDRMNHSETFPLEADASVIIDTTPPTVVFLFPASGAILGKRPFTLSWAGGDAPTGIAGYDVRLDTGPFQPLGTATNFTMNDAAGGPHTLKVRAADAAGSVGAASLDFLVSPNPDARSRRTMVLLVTTILGLAMAVVALLFIIHLRTRPSPASLRGLPRRRALPWASSLGERRPCSVGSSRGRSVWRRCWTDGASPVRVTRGAGKPPVGRRPCIPARLFRPGSTA